MPSIRTLLPACVLTAVIAATLGAQQPKIYWADEVPKGWTGKWPAKYLTIAEKTSYSRTMTSLDLLEYVDTLKWNSENLHVFPIFTSVVNRIQVPAIVLANPRATSGQAAQQSGKPVIYLQANIHPPEPEGAEAMLMVIRDILFGTRKNLLDNQILIFCPIFNADGTDALALQDGTPHIAGIRANAAGFDLNRDGVKLETMEVNALYQNVLNRWDPVLFFDAHLMGRVRHGYANAYTTSMVPAAHAAPRQYVWDTLFPAVREQVRKEFGLEVFTHAGANDGWPPTVWSADNAIWSVEAKFLVADYGLRNRMAILTETPGHPTFERRIYAHYAYMLALLEYTNAHGKEMLRICRDADQDVVARATTQPTPGGLRNWVEGKYESRGKIDLLHYRTNEAAYIPGTSVRGNKPGTATGPPELVHGVDDLTKPVGTKDAWMPRAYLLPAALKDVAAKLRAHNIRVSLLDKPMRVAGDEFVVDRMSKQNAMTRLQGGFFAESVREFPAGSFYVDMAQPMANAAFYYLEPQSMDGFVGWGVLDAALTELGVETHPVVYPVFKVRREVKPGT